MDSRLFALTLPSLALLGLLVLHSAMSLSRRQAATWWVAVVTFGALRGLGVRFVTDRTGASFPYVIQDPLFELGGVSLQEIAGWSIVAYLGWWLGEHFARTLARGGGPRLFPQVAWAAMWLGAIAWGVESTAVAAGWWRWTVATPPGVLGRVPLIGLVDWAFVAIDFVLPFLAFATARAPRPAWRWWTLAAFPLHFGGHLFTDRIGFVPVFHAVHWALVVTVLWNAARSPTLSAAFRSGRWTIVRALPAVAVGVLLADLLIVQVAVLGRPDLLPSLVPATIVALVALRPKWGVAATVLALVCALGWRELVVAAVPVTVALAVGWARGGRRWRAATVVGALVGFALVIHQSSARVARDLVSELDAAVAARDAGDLPAAVTRLDRVRRTHPQSHAALVLLGEIHYRVGRLAQALEAFEAALDIKHDLPLVRRHLAVIFLQQGDPGAALEAAQAGLRMAPDDLELTYLARRASGDSDAALHPRMLAAGPTAAETLAMLAFEIDDAADSAELLDAAIQRWPEHARFYDLRARVALAQNDVATARHVVDVWRKKLPNDPEAQALGRRMGLR